MAASALVPQSCHLSTCIYTSQETTAVPTYHYIALSSVMTGVVAGMLTLPLNNLTLGISNLTTIYISLLAFLIQFLLDI